MKQVDWKAEFDQYPDDIKRQWHFFKSKYMETEPQCVPKKLVYVDGKLSKNNSIPLDRANLKKIKMKKQIMEYKKRNVFWGEVAIQ